MQQSGAIGKALGLAIDRYDSNSVAGRKEFGRFASKVYGNTEADPIGWLSFAQRSSPRPYRGMKSFQMQIVDANAS
jgi:hypothetical protein